jgi:acyl-ACP thioesterase
MTRYPRIGEKITLHTFPMPNRICFFPRYYIFTDAHGEMVGKAGTLWLLLDTQTRRMLPPGDIAKLIPDNRDLTVPMNLPATVGNLQGEEFVSNYTPVYTDLDVNGHVNNTRYTEWAMDCLPDELTFQHTMREIEINFNREARPGETVELLHAELEGVHYVEGRVGEQQIFITKMTF